MERVYSIRNYEVDIDDQFYMVTKETAKLIERATYECKTGYSGWCSSYAECFSVHCWLNEYINENVEKIEATQYESIEGVDYKDQETIKKIVESLKTAKRLRIEKLRIRKQRDGITYEDIRIEQGVKAEQILENKLLSDIFRDYLKDDGLRSEVVKRVQEILDLISEHLQFRQGEREKLDEKRKEHKKECQQKINQSYQEYLERCRNYSSQDNPSVLQEERRGESK